MRRVPFKQAHLLLDVVIHYARTVLCTKKWMACASSCTIAHLIWWGTVQSQPHKKCYLSHTPWAFIIIIIIMIVIIIAHTDTSMAAASVILL